MENHLTTLENDAKLVGLDASKMLEDGYNIFQIRLLTLAAKNKRKLPKISPDIHEDIIDLLSFGVSRGVFIDDLVDSSLDYKTVSNTIKDRLKTQEKSNLVESIKLESAKTIIPSFIGTLITISDKNPEIKSEVEEIMNLLWWVNHNFYKLTQFEIEGFLLTQVASLNRTLNESKEPIKLLQKHLNQLRKSAELIKNRPNRIKSNMAKCLACGDVIQSKNTHDFVWCSCKKIAVDGGQDYLKRVAESEDMYLEMSEYF